MFGFERISRTAYLYQMIYFISGAELVFVFFIILLVFGADKVPDIARTLGKGMRQVRNATQDIKDEIQKSAEKQGLRHQTNRARHQRSQRRGRRYRWVSQTKQLALSGNRQAVSDSGEQRSPLSHLY